MESGPKKQGVISWDEYIEQWRHAAPRPLLTESIELCEARGQALDLGAGSLNETRYLLEEGFEVTAVDQAPLMADIAEQIGNPNLHVASVRFEEYKFPANRYTLVNASYSLPFISPDAFSTVFANMKGSIVSRGIFSGQLFGTRDGWASRNEMTFHTPDQVRDLFSDMELLRMEEVEHDALTAAGNMKHWHVFDIIARKH